MPICAYPQVRIYEDFDKMSAKEVYYNEAGAKVTVKLLHYPDIPPDEVHKIKFIDDNDSDNLVDNNNTDCVTINGSHNIYPRTRRPHTHHHHHHQDRRGSQTSEKKLNLIKIERNNDDNNDDDDEEEEVDEEEDEEEIDENASEGVDGKKKLRKKSSGNLSHKCSKAFAVAHGISITPPTPTPTSTTTASQTDENFNSYGIPVPKNSLKLPGGGSPSTGALRKLSAHRKISTNSCGYAQYSKSLLEVPIPRDYCDASSDDLSSEWESDAQVEEVVPVVPEKVKPSGWRKIRNIVQWTPFFQTYKKQRYPWVQLAGHQGNFKAGPEQGTVLKKLCPKEELCFQVLMKDVMRPYVPEYRGQLSGDDGEFYLQLQDLLSDFNQPCVMDCKIGVRTYLEEELSKAKEKPKLRKDMYEKMIQIDPNAPSEEEHQAKGVTKPRYMVWRETISSTATLGFRIEGIKKGDGTSSKDFKTTKSRDQIMNAFKDYVRDFPHCLPRYLQRLRAIRATLECSDFFQSHEIIGSSLLFVHDNVKANIWLIDFAKTVSLPVDHKINHSTLWKVGNHEDGYLIGINNLIEMFNELNGELEKEKLSNVTVSCASNAESTIAEQQQHQLEKITAETVKSESSLLSKLNISDERKKC